MDTVLNLYLIPNLTHLVIEYTKNFICTILYVEPDDKHHLFICRDQTNQTKFSVYTKYDYVYNSLSHQGFNLTCWYERYFRQIINRLIEFETQLIWNDVIEGDNGPILCNTNDQFCQWLSAHYKLHRDNGSFDCEYIHWDDEIFPNRNTTESPVEELG